jgi:GAF domain-containing protein
MPLALARYHRLQRLFSIISKDADFLSMPIGKGLAGHVAKTGRPLNIHDAYSDVRFDASCDKQTGYRTRAILCMPIKNADDGTTIGVITAINKRQKASAAGAKAHLIRSGLCLLSQS